jgi:hypothetical protein
MFLPAVAVNASGRVAVTWDSISSINRDRQIPTTPMAAVSNDQGRSWTTAALSQPFHLRHIETNGELFLGDYQALTATTAGFEAIYITATTNPRSKKTIVVSQAIG